MSKPSTYTEEVAAKICERIAQGKTLRAICRGDTDVEGVDSPGWCPHFTTVYDWLNQNEDFALRFARARDIGADAIAQETLDIADTPVEGRIETDKVDRDGAPYTEVRRADMIEHRKLQIDTRLKLLSKWNPKKYGESSRLDIGNADGEPFKIAGAADVDTAARIVALFAAVEKRLAAQDDEDYSDIA